MPENPVPRKENGDVIRCASDTEHHAQPRKHWGRIDDVTKRQPGFPRNWRQLDDERDETVSHGLRLVVQQLEKIKAAADKGDLEGVKEALSEKLNFGWPTDEHRVQIIENT